MFIPPIFMISKKRKERSKLEQNSATIIRFPNYNIYNVPEALRKLANEIEDDPELCCHIIISMMSADGDCSYRVFGRDLNRIGAVGILEYVKRLIIGT